MTYGPFETDTLLDLTVNMIPLAVLLFFVVLFLVINPWYDHPFGLWLAIGLTLVPFFILGLLTYVAGLVIQRDERAAEDAEA